MRYRRRGLFHRHDLPGMPGCCPSPLQDPDLQHRYRRRRDRGCPGGVYPANIAIDVSPERLRRFFIREETGFRIKKEIREMVVFAVQDVIKDPPFTRLDLILSLIHISEPTRRTPISYAV